MRTISSPLPLVSVIILNCNGGVMTQKCLRSVLKSTYPKLEIIIVDNNSKSRERGTLQKKFAHQVTFIISSQNLGYTGGNNLGATHAKGEYLVFLNNDTRVYPDWLQAPVSKLMRDRSIAFIQPKILWMKNPHFFDYAGGAGGFIDMFGYPFLRGRVFGTLEEDVGQYDDEREIFWASGVALFCQKKVFNKLGRFDTYLYYNSEEEDICFRALRMGYRILYCPDSRILHYGEYTVDRDVPKKTYYNHRNHIILLIKNLTLSELLFVLPVRFLLDIATIFLYIFGYRSPLLAKTVISAYRSVVAGLADIIKSRKAYGKLEYGYPRQDGLVYKGSIAWDYFLRGRCRWSEIFRVQTSTGKVRKIF